MTFGGLKIRLMRSEHIDQLTIALRARPGRKRQLVGGTRVKALLEKVTRSVLDLAYERELMPKNPHKWFKKQRQERVDIDPFSIEEMLSCIEAVPTPQAKRYFTVAFGTGMSPSEQIALEWEHIDFKTRRIYVRQGFVKGRLTLLKNDNRYRDIEMFPHVEQALRDQWEATQGQGGWVFPNADGGPLHLDNLRNRVWNPALALAGLRPRNPYQTRHSYASQLLSEGADPAWVAEMMGHANTRMIVLKYWKYIRNRAHPDGRGYLEALQQTRERVAGANRP
jgi:integrase